MEPLLIDFNEKAYKTKIAKLERFAECLQSVIDSFNLLEIGEFENKDLENLIFRTETFVFDKSVPDKSISVGGLKLNRAKLLDLVEKPAGYHTLIEEIRVLLKTYENVKGSELFSFSSLSDLLKYYTFNEDNKIVPKREYYDKIKRENETYVSSEQGINAYKFGIELIELLNKNRALIPQYQSCGKFIDRFFNNVGSVLNINVILEIDRNARGKR